MQEQDSKRYIQSEDGKRAEHTGSVTVNAPVEQVYAVFSRFELFPQFMHHVTEVRKLDNERSHWVVEIVGRHEWDAVNQGWVTDRVVGWRSTDGLENSGRVTFRPLGDTHTLLDVYISYNPPAGVLGDIGEALGAGKRFEIGLRHDLERFAQTVADAPAGALDANSPNYLFHNKAGGSGSDALPNTAAPGSNADTTKADLPNTGQLN